MSPADHPELRLAADRDRLREVVRELRREVARLRDFVASVRSAPGAAEPVSEDLVRLDAISLAVNGASREDVERELRGRYGDLPAGVLDSVFGDDPQLNWGGAEIP
jgi:hypothetical protein